MSLSPAYSNYIAPNAVPLQQYNPGQQFYAPQPQQSGGSQLMNTLKQLVMGPQSQQQQTRSAIVGGIADIENQRAQCQNNLNSVLYGLKISGILILILLIIFFLAVLAHWKYTKCPKKEKEHDSMLLKAGDFIFWVYILIGMLAALISIFNIWRIWDFSKQPYMQQQFISSCMANQPVVLTTSSGTGPGVVIDYPANIGQNIPGNIAYYS